MLADVVLTEFVEFPVNKTITLDLAGHNVTRTNGNCALDVYGNVTLVDSGRIDDGERVYGKLQSAVPVWVNAGGEFTLTSGAINASDRGIMIQGNGTATLNGGTVTSTGWGVTMFGTAKLTVNNGANIAATDNAAIATNGTAGNNVTIEIKGGTITSENEVGIFQPSGTVTVSGGDIRGTTGIYTKSGSLTVEGGTITGNGSAAAYSPTGDGWNATGDALVVDNCGYPSGAPIVTITDGTFTSANGKDIGSYHNDTEEDLASVKAYSDGISIPDNEMWVSTETAGVYKLVEAVVVTFNTAGGTPVTIAEQRIEKGTKATKPADPEKAADAHGEYEFKGWFAPDADEAFDFNTPVTENLELTAHYAFTTFIYPVGEGGVKIAGNWISTMFGDSIDVGNYTQVKEKLSSTADNGMLYWQNYVLGLTGAKSEKLTIWGAAPETQGKTGVATGNYVIFGELGVPQGWTAASMKVGNNVSACYKLMVRKDNGTLSDVIINAEEEVLEPEVLEPVAVTSNVPEFVVPMNAVYNQTLVLVIEITVTAE